MLGTMPPKKKKPGSRTPKKGKGGATRDNQIGFRAFDPRMVEILDSYADSQDRSRNYIINKFIEDSLKNLGLWPPPADQADVCTKE